MSTLSAVNTATSSASDIGSSILGGVFNALGQIGSAAVSSTLSGVFQQKPQITPAPAPAQASTPGVSSTAPASSAPIVIAAPQPKSEGATAGFLDKYGEILLVLAAAVVAFKALK